MSKWTGPSVLVMIFLGGCMVGPTYRRPVSPLPEAYTSVVGPASASVGMPLWWRQFNDPLLDRLIAKALSDNYDMQAAALRIQQARTREALTRGGQGPKLTASAQASDTRLSANALPSGLAGLLGSGASDGGPETGPEMETGLGLPGTAFSAYQAGFDALWEPDLFGGQHRAAEAAQARTQASVWTQRDAQVSLTAEVANSYLQYRFYQKRLALADDTLTAAQQSVALTQARQRNGLGDTTAVRQAEADLAQVAALRDQMAAEADIRLQTLAYLLGPASAEMVAEVSATPAPAFADIIIPAGLPSVLLQRRPDIRAAERQLAAATADIGTARADLYPKLSLTGVAQLVSQSLSSLLEGDSVQASLAGRLSLPIIDGAVRRNSVALHEARASEAAALYQKQVFAALREVETALTRLEGDRQALAHLAAAEAAAQDAAETADIRYRHGLVAQAGVLTARRRHLSAQDAVVQAEATHAQDMVAFYKALGGGWVPDALPNGGTDDTAD